MKVVIYARTSCETEKMECSSIENQIETCSKYSEKNDYKVVNIFSEIGSTKSGKRLGLIAMLDFIEQSEVDKVLVYSANRLGRSIEDYILVKAMIMKTGTQLITVNEPEISAESQLLETLISAALRFAEALRVQRYIK